MNAGGVQVGEVSVILSTYSIIDNDGNVVGMVTRNPNLTLIFDVKDVNGEVEYSISKAMVSIGASIGIERKVQNPDVSI